jgi:hypothetical protein
VLPAAGVLPSLELCGVYDFWHEIGNPMEPNDDRADTVFVLRQRGLAAGRIAGRRVSTLRRGKTYSGFSTTSLACPSASKVKSATFFDRYAVPVPRHGF